MKPIRPSKTVRRAFAEFPTEYRALCTQVHLPRPLHTRQEYAEALVVAEALAGHPLSADQEDYLDALSSFIEDWERAHEAKLPNISPVELLAFLLAENGLTGADLAKILKGSRSLASRILSGERQLTTSHIAALCSRFHLEPGAFLRPAPPE
jgi:HTH-type transcriptional regulator/antitoxin HigA